ncbi:MAG: hypothetical protein J3K34DRAFT_5015 [Monoraphidium minutum]|nr:MAG: hypothetical protein J3K34DRAFT_5015 [Monoraphidium minutum]
MRERPVVLITGCSAGGIGHALAREFASRGCAVFATARRAAAMAGLAEAGCALLELDVTDTASIFGAVESTMQAAGRIDILVNNAGLGGRGPVVDYDLAVARRVMDTNFFGTMAVTQAVVPHMLARRSGAVINIGSALGLITLPFTGVYSASKRAVRGLTDALRIELRGSGVAATYVAPGWVRSNISEAGAHGALNQIDAKGPWAPCAPHVTGDLFAARGRARGEPRGACARAGGGRAAAGRAAGVLD